MRSGEGARGSLESGKKGSTEAGGGVREKSRTHLIPWGNKKVGLPREGEEEERGNNKMDG